MSTRDWDYLQYFKRTTAVQALAFSLLFTTFSLVTAFLVVANYLAPNLLFQITSAIGVALLLALLVAECFRILDWAKRSLQSQWQYRTPPHNDATVANQLNLFPTAVWHEKHRKPIAEIRARSVYPTLKMGLYSTIISLAIMLIGNFATPILVVGWTTSGIHLPQGTLQSIAHGNHATVHTGRTNSSQRNSHSVQYSWPVQSHVTRCAVHSSLVVPPRRCTEFHLGY